MSLFGANGDAPVVSARDLALAYGGRRILADATFRIMTGEWWFVLGPNGAGKTTLVRALLGQLAPTAGGIALGPGLDDRTRLGYVAQRVDLPPTVPTTVREFVGLGFAGIRLPAAERARRLAAALARVGLADREREAMAELSGGQRQRASIARALVREPLLLVLDEPTTGLDLVAERDLLALIADLNRAGGLTVVYVGHDLAVAAAHASHVALVAGGTVRGGPAAELLTKPILSAAFGIAVEAPHA